MSDWGVPESDGPGSLTAEWTITLSGFDPNSDWRDHPALDEIETVVHDIAERHDLDVGMTGHLIMPPDIPTKTVVAVTTTAEMIAACSEFIAPAEEIMHRIAALRSTLEQEGGEPHA